MFLHRKRISFFFVASCASRIELFRIQHRRSSSSLSLGRSRPSGVLVFGFWLSFSLRKIVRRLEWSEQTDYTAKANRHFKRGLLNSWKSSELQEGKVNTPKAKQGEKASRCPTSPSPLRITHDRVEKTSLYCTIWLLKCYLNTWQDHSDFDCCIYEEGERRFKLQELSKEKELMARRTGRQQVSEAVYLVHIE